MCLVTIIFTSTSAWDLIKVIENTSKTFSYSCNDWITHVIKLIKMTPKFCKFIYWKEKKHGLWPKKFMFYFQATVASGRMLQHWFISSIALLKRGMTPFLYNVMYFYLNAFLHVLRHLLGIWKLLGVSVPVFLHNCSMVNYMTPGKHSTPSTNFFL